MACKHQPKNTVDYKHWHTLDLEAFRLWLPPNWRYHQQQGVDSFVADIVGPNVSFSFDFSSMGYASHLVNSEQEYLNSNYWLTDCRLCHTPIDREQIAQTDSSIKINKLSKSEIQKFPGIDYLASVTYKDGSIHKVPIVIPAETKAYCISEESKDGFIVKTIYPKIASNGITGIYYQSKSSNLNFQLSAYNLSKQDQNLALQMFKTIVIKTQ